MKRMKEKYYSFRFFSFQQQKHIIIQNVSVRGPSSAELYIIMFLLLEAQESSQIVYFIAMNLYNIEK